jgi:hypothetical protein
MKDTGQILEEFRDLAESRCIFDLENGSHFEGYILEIKDRNIVFGGGGPLAPCEDELIPIEKIDLDTLFYWSNSKRCYVHSRWDTEQNEWKFTPLSQAS